MKHRVMNALSNVFGGFGYLSNVFQWLWVFGIYLPQILESRAGVLFVPDAPPVPADTTVATASFPAIPTPVAIAIVVVIFVLVVLMTVVGVMRLPKQIAEAGKKTTHTAAAHIVPVVTRHKKVPERKRRQLTARMVLAIKAILAVIPLLLLYIPRPSDFMLSDYLVMLVGSFLAIGTVVWFALQLISAKIAGVREDTIA